MAQFKYKDLHIKADTELVGFGLVYINEKTSFNIIITILFFAIGFEVRKSDRKRRKLIKAIVEDYRFVKISKNGYDEFYPYSPEFEVNDKPYVFRRTKLGEWTKVHDFTSSRLGYICRYTDEFGKWNKISRFNDDEICIYKPNSVVRGYFRGGNFVVVD